MVLYLHTCWGEVATNCSLLLMKMKTFRWTVFNVTEQHWGSGCNSIAEAPPTLGVQSFSRVVFLHRLAPPHLLAELLSVHWHQVECPSHQGETWRHRTSPRPTTSTTEPDSRGEKHDRNGSWRSSRYQTPNLKIHESEAKPPIIITLVWHTWRINMWINEAPVKKKFHEGASEKTKWKMRERNRNHDTNMVQVCSGEILSGFQVQWKMDDG